MTGAGDEGPERFVLAIDQGTGGPKVGLVSLAGTIAWCEHIPVETRRLPGGGAVQDACAWWSIICDAARQIGRAHV
jgi:xylulokinase